jgi:hypothetical protein
MLERIGHLRSGAADRIFGPGLGLLFDDLGVELLLQASTVSVISARVSSMLVRAASTSSSL